MKDEWAKLAETCAQRGAKLNIASILKQDNAGAIEDAEVSEYPTIRLYDGQAAGKVGKGSKGVAGHRKDGLGNKDGDPFSGMLN